MSHVVGKPFKTATRKFAAGVDVAPEDVADCAMSWDDLMERGFVVAGDAAAELPAPMRLDESAN